MGKTIEIAFSTQQSLGKLYVNDDFVYEKFYAEAVGRIRLPQNCSIHLKLNPQSCSDLSRLQSLEGLKITALSIEGAELTAKQFQFVANLPSLEKIHIAHCQILSEAFPVLRLLPNLTELRLWWLPIGDQVSEYLAELELLRVLDLSRTGITDKTLHQLKQCKTLKTLVLTDSKVTDSGVMDVCNSLNLHHLSLSKTQISALSVGAASQINSLKRLELDYTNVSTLNQMSADSAVEALDISFTKVGDESIPTILRLPGLKQLRCAGTSLTPMALQRLESARGLSVCSA